MLVKTTGFRACPFSCKTPLLIFVDVNHLLSMVLCTWYLLQLHLECCILWVSVQGCSLLIWQGALVNFSCVVVHECLAILALVLHSLECRILCVCLGLRAVRNTIIYINVVESMSFWHRASPLMLFECAGRVVGSWDAGWHSGGLVIRHNALNDATHESPSVFEL